MLESVYYIFNGDCLDVMKKIPDSSVDCVICDLPYGSSHNRWDVVIPFNELWEQYLRIGKETAPYILFGQGIFYVDLVNSNRRMFKYDLVYDKKLVTGFLNAKRMPLRRHEQIAVFYRKQPVFNPQFTEGQPLHGRGSKYMDEEMVNNNYNSFKPLDDVRKGSTQKYPTSLLEFKKPHPSVTKHPTEKSIELLEWLVRSYTNAGDAVLDNCMGAGSTGIACINTGRNFIGIEKDTGYFRIAEERLEEAADSKNTNIEKE